MPQTVNTVIHLGVHDVLQAARSRHGLTYKGFGALSGNSTSALLLDYKAAHPESYWTLVRTLFGGSHPILNTVKVEMGNDRNNSTGPNAATMRDRDEYPAVAREPGFQLAADARRYQPDVHVSILRWHAPTWVRTNDDVYRWYKNTILAAYRRYGLMVDSVNPDVNERTADLEWVAQFAQRVRHDDEGFIGSWADDPNAGFASDTERELFHRIRVITSDEETTGTFAGELLGSAEYMNDIDIASYHYSVQDDPDGNFTRLADEYDKEVWNSEAQAVFSNSADRPNNTMDNGLGERTGTDIGGIGGPLEMANTLIKGFVRSRRTHTIYQPAIGAQYEHEEYASKELISARDPWSGWIYYDAGCAVLEHFAHFARLGWESNDPTVSADARGVWRAIPQASDSHVAGDNPVSGARHGEDSYLTLAAPDGSDFSTILVNDSALEHTYDIVVEGDGGTEVNNVLATGIEKAMSCCGKPLTVLQTTAAAPGERYNARWMQPVAVIAPQAEDTAGFTQGSSTDDSNTTRGSHAAVRYRVTVRPWSMVTVTTLESADRVQGGQGDGSAALVAKSEYASVLPTVRERAREVLDTDPDAGVLYADDFNYDSEPDVEMFSHDAMIAESYLESRGGRSGAIPRYTNDTNGAFEVVPDGERGHVLRQQIDWPHAGNAWIEGDPRTAIGDMRWTDYRVTVDVMFEPYEGRAPYVMLGAREMGGNKFTEDICAYDVKLRADGVWLLRRFGAEMRRGHLQDLRKAAASAGTVPFAPGAGAWNTIGLEVTGAQATWAVNGTPIASWTDPAPQSAGRVNLGSSFNHVRFSNLRVERVPGHEPYYRRLIDDMHMRSWDDGSPLLEYAGPWTHDNGQSMFTYMRTISRACAPGASISYEFEGSGLDLFGPSDGSAALDVIVDGVAVSTNRPVAATNGSLRCEFQVRGLDRGHHRVTLRTCNDHEFSVDAVGVLG